jgi:putative flippase GtrA
VRDTLSRVVVRPSHHLPHWLRMSRYTMGSAICFAVSEVVFIALFWPHLLGARSASIVASIAGIIPGYYLNRTWTWGRRERSDFWREVVPYWATALGGAIAAALAIGVVNNAAIHSARSTRTLLNAGTYMATYGVLFAAKYAFFQKILFKPPPLDLHEVDATDDGERDGSTGSNGSVASRPKDAVAPLA